MSDLVKKPEIIKLFADRIEGQSKDLAHHEKIVKFTLLDRLFTIEDDEMTPSNKLKRRVIAQKYDDVIKKMYED
jgi:long-chain acyl-CoA synthetase